MNLRPLPMDWQWANAGDLLSGIEAGASPSGLDHPAGPYERGVIKISAVTYGEFRPYENKALPPGFDATGIPTVRAGDLLMTRANTTELVGAVALVTSDHPNLILCDKTLRLVPNASVHAGYLARALRTDDARRHIEGRATGTSSSMRNISQDTIRLTPVPLPPLSEQRRIADVLDRADAIQRKRRMAVALVDDLLRSAFLDMFGDPVLNARAWPVKSLSACIVSIVPGWSVGGEAGKPGPGERAVLKISAVTSGRFRPDECKVVAEAVPSDTASPGRGDLLFSRANTRELVAASCLVEDDYPNLFLPDKLWKIVAQPNVCRVEYLRFLFQHEGFRSTLTSRATGTSGSMLNLSQEKLMEAKAPIPPLATQDKFAALVWSIFGARRRLDAAAADSEGLFNTLVHQAFRGEL